MSGFWQFTNATTGGTAQSAPAGAAAAGEQIRIRSIEASVGATAGVLTITDGVPNTYLTLGIPANGSIAETGFDIRINVGQNAIVSLTNGSGVNVQGDFVTIGYPYGLT